jgi:hypothetical protein
MLVSPWAAECTLLTKALYNGQWQGELDVYCDLANRALLTSRIDSALHANGLEGRSIMLVRPWVRIGS